MDEQLASFKKLSSTLQAKIKARPTKTFLANSSQKIINSYAEMGKLWNLEDPNPRSRTPEEFDGRIAWRGLLGKIEDQGGCGSCWAFAATTMLAQRFNIQSRGLINIGLSQTKLILCDWEGKELEVQHPELAKYSWKLSKEESIGIHKTACYGNSLIDACRYLYEIGTCTEKCIPYNKTLSLEVGDFQKIASFNRGSPAGTQLPLCNAVSGPVADMCAGSRFDIVTGEESGIPIRFFRGYHYYGIYGVPGEKIINSDPKEGIKIAKEGGELQIRREIWRWGPVATGFRIYPDFYTFNAKSEIYKWNGKGPQVGGHAIVILGWGTENDVKYWIIRNSWGEKWGDGGYFRILRGSNECGIEDNVIGMVPDFFYPTGYVLKDYRTSEGPGYKGNPRHLDRLRTVSHGRTPSQRATRNKISDNVLDIAGGIDPLTGYTRRVMITMPWLDFQRPVFLEDLPDWSSFVAGKDATPSKRNLLLQKLDSITKSAVMESQVTQIYKYIISLLIILVAVVSCVIIYKKIKH